jgi:DNA processing protein
VDNADRLVVLVLSVFHPRYPAALRQLSDRPAVVFVKGQIPAPARNVACIGTRTPSPFGLRATREIVESLVHVNWTIVSGLALGIDTEAHSVALANNGRTIAALGGGLDRIYPKENSGLAAQILDSGGALLSEQPLGVSTNPRNLIQRDRLQSGLSVGTVLMQSDLKGGSMHTVRFTLQQERLLFAVVSPEVGRKVKARVTSH